MAGEDETGRLGVLLAVLPWLLAPFAGFFLFFGDRVEAGPDPRDQVIPWYFTITGLVALVGIVLGIRRREGHLVRTILTVLIGGGWVALSVLMVARPLWR